ncbi:MAG: restriction endonuclease [Lachnospiraceae bacterium]|nr:restriction endonuclease [Lachnospiraceae bacterium]
MYDFSNLSDEDFEYLCKDIMGKKLGIELMRFSTGKDGGIDLTDDVDKKNIVVQMKHYYNTNISGLFASLRKEVKNVKKLNPQKYYVCCSKRLTPKNKEDIFQMFSDYMESTQNIISLIDIIDFLDDDKNRDILKKHNKLWIGSTNILKETIQEIIKEPSTISTLGMRTGKGKEVKSLEKAIGDYLDEKLGEHPFFPYYRYAIDNDKIQSKAVNAEAAKLYPANFQITGLVKFGDKYYDKEDNPFEYSYRHQLVMTIEIEDAVRKLGPFKDPIQTSAQEYVGKEHYYKPPEFPPAFPCSIKVGETVYYDYILLRTQEISDEGEYFISNAQQKISSYFEIRINPQNPQNPYFYIKEDFLTNASRLNYVEFIQALEQNKDLHIFMLDERKDFIAGYINDIGYKPQLYTIENDIDFLERLCILDEYFGIELNPQGEISREEMEDVFHFSNLIKEKKLLYRWIPYTASYKIGKDISLEEINSFRNTIAKFDHTGVLETKLFGENIELPIKVEINGIKTEIIPLGKESLDELEIGDEVNISFLLEKNDYIIETLR